MQKDIGNYIVHSDGKVWSKWKKNWMKLQIHQKGYYRLPINGRKTLLHRLIAETFIPNPNNLSDVNHLDLDKLNCSVSNLEWATSKENFDHAVSNGLFRKLTENQVKEIKYANKSLTQEQIAKIYNTTRSNIKRIKNNETWKHI